MSTQVPRKVKDRKTISGLEDYTHLQLVTTEPDISQIKEMVGGISTNYDAFFVDVNRGEYTEVWGFKGVVPYVQKQAERIV